MNPKNLLPIIAVLGIIIVIGVLLTIRQSEVNRDQAATLDLKEQIQFAQDAGIWDKDLTSLAPKVSSLNDAGPLYRQAAALIERRKGPGHSPNFDDPKDTALFADYLNRIKPALDLATQASLRRSINFQLSNSEAWDTEFPDYTDLKTLAKCLNYRVGLEIHAGRN